MMHFRPDTWDHAIAQSVMSGEYGAIDFAGRTVLDIGAHIGSFSLLAASLGARRIVACEANLENYTILRRHCAALPAIECRHAAVWCDEDLDAPLLWRPHRHAQNTGGGSVLPDDSLTDDRTEAVSRLSFDRLVETLGHVDLVKIDAEGSEYPILLDSRRLDRVGEIVGEFHTLAPGQMRNADWNLRGLVLKLQSAGFIVERQVHADLGLFRAFRPLRDTAALQND